MDWETLQARLGIRFRNLALYEQAFTHSSYVNEHKRERIQHNERLEFLGDAVLELAISQFLFETFPHMSEGEMTKLRAAIVCEPSLVSFAEELGFKPLIRLGRGEELTGGRHRPSLLADVFEAFVGALYLDQGLDAVFAFLDKVVFPRVRRGDFAHTTDYKSLLQELVQQDNLGELTYRIVEERGPAHNREFVSEVLLNQQTLGRGRGRSKKEAEQNAAAMALEVLGARR